MCWMEGMQYREKRTIIIRQKVMVQIFLGVQHGDAPWA